jgi:predicted P-loop ATPase
MNDMSQPLTPLRRSRRKADEPSWAKGAPLVRDDWGRIRSNLENVCVALERDPALMGRFAYDEMLREAVITAPIGRSTKGNHAEGYPTPIQDHHGTLVQRHLQRSGLPQVGIEAVLQAMESVARERPFHPVRNYLSELAWDGTPRLDRWLTTYMGAEVCPYHDAIGAMFMTALVKRIFEPGCQADYMLVFEDREQGTRKSSACKILGGEYFSDSLPSLRFGQERASQHIKDKWIIEVGELSSFKGADADLLKQFITRRKEDYHAPYGRKDTHEPRQCLFVGTTNKETYLTDETGNRRYWPVRTRVVRLDELARDKDQLFAEAVVRYRAGAATYPDRDFEARYIKPQQEARRFRDAWEDQVKAYIADKESVLVGEVARKGLELTNDKLGTREQRRIGAILVSLGWHKSETAIDGYWPYLRPGVTH